MNINNFFKKVSAKMARDLAREFEHVINNAVDIVNESDAAAGEYFIEVNKGIEKNGDIHVLCVVNQYDDDGSYKPVHSEHLMSKSRKRQVLINYIVDATDAINFANTQDIAKSIKINALIEKR